MSDVLDNLKSMDSATLAILGFAAVLLIFLLVLIIVTIKILKTGGRYEEDEDENYGRRNTDYVEDSDDDEEEDDDDDDEEEDDDETSRKIREAVESVEETKARVESERIAREMEEEEKAAQEEMRKSAASMVEEIVESVSKKDSEDTEEKKEKKSSSSLADRFASIKEEAEKAGEPEPVDESEEDDEYGDDPIADSDTQELDTKKIVEELKKERKAAQEEPILEMAKQRAEAPEYNASFDSAFVDRPSNEEKKEPVIPNPTPESILGADAPVPEAVTAKDLGDGSKDEAKDVEAPKEVIKKKKKKKEKVVRPATPIEEYSGDKVAKYYWYNKQDVEDLTRKEDMYFKSHYFNDADDIILDVITEMYDCGYVKTEELQRIAYGITFKSLGMKEILQSKENLGFNKEDATKEPTDTDKQEAYEKWCGYVDRFMEIIVIDAPDEVKEYILNKMYDYGNRDIEDLMYSPY